MRRRVAAAIAVSVMLSGCASAAGARDPEAADDVPLLACDDVVPGEDLLALALTGTDGVRPSPLPAMPPLEFDPFPMLLPAAGGLRCSWNAGESADDYWRTDWAYLSVEALPDVHEALAVRDADDAPVESFRPIAGFDAIATCQDWMFECLVGASVEGTWLQVRLHWTDFKSDSRFAALDHEVVLDRLAAVAEPAFAAIAAAEPAQLHWPAAPGDAGARCEGIGTATPVSHERLPDFSSLIAERAGVVLCKIEADYVYIVPGAASVVDAIVHGPDFDVALEPFDDRVGYPSLMRPWAPGAYFVVLTIGEDAYVIGAIRGDERARAVVEART